MIIGKTRRLDHDEQKADRDYKTVKGRVCLNTTLHIIYSVLEMSRIITLTVTQIKREIKPKPFK